MDNKETKNIEKDENFEMFKMRVDADPKNVSTPDNDGAYPLHLACIFGTLDKVKYLLDIWPQALSISNNDGFYPIHYACLGGNVEIVDFLIKNGANMSVTTYKGANCIHCAIMAKSINVVKYFTNIEDNRVLKKLLSDKMLDEGKEDMLKIITK